jgi:predicted transposase
MEIVRTLKLKLAMPVETAQRTVEAWTQACNAVSRIAFDHGSITNAVHLHGLAYEAAKSYGLSAQLAQSAIRNAIRAHRAIFRGDVEGGSRVSVQGAAGHPARRHAGSRRFAAAVRAFSVDGGRADEGGSVLRPARSARQARQNARMVAGTGGVIGAWVAVLWQEGLAGLIRHMFRLIDAVGIDHVGIGTDLPAGAAREAMPDFTRHYQIADALRRHGMTPDEVAKVCAGNWLRVFRRVRA